MMYKELLQMNKNENIQLNKNVVLVDGAKRAAIYNFNNGNVYSINENGKNLLFKICNNKGKYSLVNNEKIFIETLLQSKLIGFKYIGKHVIEKHNNEPLSFAWLELIELCNEKCIHCYESFSSKERCRNILSFDFWKETIKQLRQVGCKNIQLIGGEPFLHPEILKIVDYAFSKNFEITIFTNATLLNNEIIEFCKNRNVKFKVSLYGHNSILHDKITKTAGSFNSTMKNLLKIKTCNIPLSIAIVIMKENQNNLEHIRDYILELGFQYEGFDLIRNVFGGCQENHLVTNNSLKMQKYITKPSFITNKRFFNNAIINNTCWSNKIAVTSKGELIPCVFERDLILGDLKKNTLKDIIKSVNYKFALGLNKDKIDICKDCEYRYACKDCRPLGKSNNGNIYAKYSRCTYNPYIGIWENLGN